MNGRSFASMLAKADRARKHFAAEKDLNDHHTRHHATCHWMFWNALHWYLTMMVMLHPRCDEYYAWWDEFEAGLDPAELKDPTLPD